MTMQRCETCGWPLDVNSGIGCKPGDCSMRPPPKFGPDKETIAMATDLREKLRDERILAVDPAEPNCNAYFRRISGTYYIDAPGLHAATRSRAFAFVVLEAVTQEQTTTQDPPPSSDGRSERSTASPSHLGNQTQDSHPEGRLPEEQDTESDE